MPLAGIAFIRFPVVIRYLLEEREDRFFATIFGAIIAPKTMMATASTDAHMHLFGFALMNKIIGNYALRRA